jgi:glucose/arabinose dehydrogenase
VLVLNAPADRGIDFISGGELFADGLRNEVGLAFDKHGRVFFFFCI